MRKQKQGYRSYIIATATPTAQLDGINRLGGRIYSKTVSLVRKTHQKKVLWLSKGAVKKYLKFKAYPCQAHSVQAVIDDYFGALHSYFSRVKKDSNSKPPYKTCKFHTFRWRATGISYKRGKLRLSMGKGNQEPLYLKIDKKFYKKVPTEISLVYNRTQHRYEFQATYKTEPKHSKVEVGKVSVGVDMGEIHPIVAFDGTHADIYNGREHRSKVRYREKSKVSINRKLSKCGRGSSRWKKLKRAKNRMLASLNAQLRDMRHKITSRFVSACHKKKAQTLVIGDLKHIRQSIAYGKKANEKLHQWAFSQIQEMITYKAKAVGIQVDTQDEAYTSQTCPSCGHRKKPSRRIYRCSKCKWQGHRDVVGASNILTAYQGWLFNPVVGAVVSPTGVRFEPHLRRLDKWSPFSGLKLSKPPTRKQRSTRL